MRLRDYLVHKTDCPQWTNPLGGLCRSPRRLDNTGFAGLGIVRCALVIRHKGEHESNDRFKWTAEPCNCGLVQMLQELEVLAEQWLSFGEETKSKSHQGYFSAGGWAATTLRSLVSK